MYNDFAYNTVLYTSRFVKRVNLVLSVLTTVQTIKRNKLKNIFSFVLVYYLQKQNIFVYFIQNSYLLKLKVVYIGELGFAVCL